MQANTKKKNNASRTLKVNAVTMGKDEWFVLYPEIKLSGEWLERLGFQPGQKVFITAGKNELVISVAR